MSLHHHPESPLLDHCPEGLPAQAYFDLDWFAAEQKAIWARNWVYAGRGADLAAGTMRRLTVAGATLEINKSALVERTLKSMKGASSWGSELLIKSRVEMPMNCCDRMRVLARFKCSALMLTWPAKLVGSLKAGFTPSVEGVSTSEPPIETESAA